MQNPNRTMTIKRLFTYIWRINAVLILFVGGLAAVALIYSLYHLAKDVTAQTSVYGKLQTNDSGVSHTSNWKLFGFTRVGETPYFYSSLTDTQSYSYGMRSKESSGVANYLFYDSQTGISHWLFPTRDWLCLNMQEVPHSDFQKLPVKRIFYTIVEKDTNGDHRLDMADRKVVAASGPDGNNYVVLIRDIDDLAEVSVLAPQQANKALIFYTRDREYLVAEIDLDTNTVVNTRPVAKLEMGQNN